jgi:D-aspartate ligase
MKPVIVLKMCQSGIGVMRSLGRQGIDVYGVDKEKGAKGFFSKYCKKSFVFPDPVTRPEACFEKLTTLGRGLNEKAILMPASDDYVSFMSKFHQALSEYFLFNIPEPSILEIIGDKSRQYRLAEKLGIPIPVTIAPESMDELAEQKHTLSFPVMVKGTDSLLWNQAFHNKGFIVDCFDDLKKYVEQALKRNIRIVVQELIIGPNENHFKVCAYYSKARVLTSIFSTNKTRQFPVACGIGSFMKSQNMPELIRLARLFFEKTGYTGVGSIEFKKDDRDGQFKLIELNPRYWRQNIQATAAGVNFPYVNYLECIGKTVTPDLNFKENICWMNPGQDFLSFLGNKKRNDISFSQYIKSVLRTDCFAYACTDDLTPAIKNFTGVLNDYILKNPFSRQVF